MFQSDGLDEAISVTMEEMLTRAKETSYKAMTDGEQVGAE